MIAKMIKIKNKKAAVGATLTWVVATFIIFFILLIFVLLTLVISKSKDKPMISEITAANEKLVLTENLISFLNSPSASDANVRVKELIVEGKGKEAKEEAENFINTFVNSLEPKPKCYVFTGGGNILFFFGDYGSIGLDTIERREKFALQNAVRLVLFSAQGQVTRLTFYAGGCGE